MDITIFRWILIITGLFIVAGIFLRGRPDRKRKPASRKRSHADRVRLEPALYSDQKQDLKTSADGDGNGRQTELDIDVEADPPGRIDPGGAGDAPVKRELPPLPDKIITVFLKARDKHVISGVQLLDAALKSGLVFGSHDIFHRLDENETEQLSRSLFSMANLVKPGTFNKSEWSTLETRGVTMFMTLPGPRAALDAWDAMLATSHRLAELLHADLLDETQQPLTRQRSLQIKKELREFDRQTAAGKLTRSP